MKQCQLFKKPMLLACHLLASALCFSQVSEQWVSRYNGPGYGYDKAEYVVVDALGNVYVTGSSNEDYATIKYDATGNQLWVKRYSGGRANSLAVDGLGNVYLTGYSYDSNGYSDYTTIKLDTDGTELWMKRYNGPGDSSDVATSLAVDASGNVYVTGESYGDGTEKRSDYATIKYDAAGNELWVNRYDGPAHFDDAATSLAVDASGHVYVTGRSGNYQDDDIYIGDYATIKYDTAGNELWVRRYSNPGLNMERATSLVVDASGNVYVTGSSDGGETLSDYATIKYDAAGNELWVKRYSNLENSSDEPSSLAVDASGNVYVTGSSYNYNGNSNSRSDYATVKYDAAGNELWVKRYNSPGNGYDYAAWLAVDAAGNVYVTGSSGDLFNPDYATIKYDTAGAELWVKRYTGPGNGSDNATSLAVDASGNVYVTGGGDPIGYEQDYVTVKYDASGSELWVNRYTGPGTSNDYATSLAVEASGNVYVTGYSYNSNSRTDYATVKYDAAGAELWAKRYNGPGNGDDYVTSLAIDASGNVYVTGYSDGSGTGYDYTTIKYDAAGNERWVKRYNGPGDDQDEAKSLAVDASGNVYVTGSSYSNVTGTDYATVKYDAAGNELWVKRYNGPGDGSDYAASVVVDASGNVYVTGQSRDSNYNYDYTTIKYDATGNERWVKRYNGPANSSDRASSMAVDHLGNVYVTGSSIGSGFEYDYATVKYDADGDEQWAKRYNGPDNFFDQARSLAVDAAGNVYVTGWSVSSGTEYDYATVKYDAAGNEQWVKRYNGPGNATDEATSLAVDSSGNVYVTGSSDGTGAYTDYATVKYDMAGNELWVKRYKNGFAQSLAIDGSGNVYVTGGGGGNGGDYITIKYLQSQAAVVSSFTLINADTDEAIRKLKEGDTLDLAALPTLNLNIRANTMPAAVGSVSFHLSGSQTRKHTENIVPYALFADNNNGDYYGWTPSNGNYTLTATPYSAAKGKGEKGTVLTIHFTVTGTAISSLILVNAETDQDIKTLQNGDVIDLAALPTDKLNIRAAVHPNTVGSVVFNLNNRYIVRENLAPYAIGGDIKGDYRAWTLPTGHHNLTATPYDGKYGRGKKGKAHSVSFTVVDKATTVQSNTGNGQQKSIAALQNSGQNLRATPNPFSGQTMISFSVLKSGYTTLQVYDMKGSVVTNLYQAWAEGGKAYTVSFKSKQLPGGVYVLRLFTDKHVQSYRLVVIR